ncbi:type II toxin-antitoxin system VapC family toxin [Chelativorans sp.]|uniref:type II toxin-antitoxin system VapC family toxin n=1 Tax=Chelativorans sp. TaxID=2203393 RepID=UPI0028114A6D|nr:type II toxin-antitoxin system VapC family toxin [Chelativorans sp.]
MSSIVVDTSALFAVLNGEEEAASIRQALDEANHIAISAATLHEAFCVSQKPSLERGPARLEKMVDLLEPEIVAFDRQHLTVARAAYARYGRGSGHRAHLNMGDCFAYALAKTRGVPLLFKGGDFVHTDVEPALNPA